MKKFCLFLLAINFVFFAKCSGATIELRPQRAEFSCQNVRGGAAQAKTEQRGNRWETLKNRAEVAAQLGDGKKKRQEEVDLSGSIAKDDRWAALRDKVIPRRADDLWQRTSEVQAAPRSVSSRNVVAMMQKTARGVETTFFSYEEASQEREVSFSSSAHRVKMTKNKPVKPYRRDK